MVKHSHFIGNLKIGQKLTVALLPVALAFLLTNTYIFTSMNASLKQSILEANQDTLRRIRDDVSTAMTTLNEESIRLLISPNVREYMEFVGSRDEEALIGSRFLRELTGSTVISGNMVKSAFLIKSSERYAYYSGAWGLETLEIRRFVSDMLEENRTLREVSFKNPDGSEFGKYGILHFVCPIPSEGGEEQRGQRLLVVNVSPYFVANIFSRYYRAGTVFFVTDRAGSLIYRMSDELDTKLLYGEAADPSQSYLELGSGGDGVLILREEIPDLGWQICIQVPRASAFSQLTGYKRIFYAASAVGLLISAGFILLATATVVRRIRELKTVMDSAARGNLDVKFPLTYTDEISLIGRELNSMIDRIKYLRFDITEKELRQREAEISALQSQINPHFIYNTLEISRMSALSHDDRETAGIIKTLSDLLRYTIGGRGGGNLVPVSQETEHIRDYLRIQKLRFGDRFSVKLEIDPLIEPYLIIKLILQPLVENAFTHGIKGLEENALIHITGRVEEDRLLFTVEDNGKGIAPERLRELEAALKLPPFEMRARRMIGLPNVNNRIKLYYGESYGVTLQSEPGRGTRVSVTLPVILFDGRDGDGDV